ncbi:MAG: hypothetical protein NTZ26_10775 [Candidatus Aminicenantes bacterium]|nr:hypothetical protein [Candidatus Aminicenantes bacterium]
MIGILNAAINGLFDALFAVLRPLGPAGAMAALSLLVGLFMLFIFKKTSNQAGIRRSKDRIKAHLLELRLYKRDFGQTMRSQGGILKANGQYVLYAVKPMLVMIIPILLVLIQLDARFGARALRPGETALVKVKVDASVALGDAEPVLETPAGIVVETPPLRIEEEHEVDWRIRAAAAGRHEMTVRIGGLVETKGVAVGIGAPAKISPLRIRRGGLDELFHPGEKPLPRGSAIASIEVTYPGTRLNYFGWRMHWLVAFFLLSIVFGFGLKGLFKVEI